MKAAEICVKAGELVGGDRQVTHGDKQVNMENIATLWNAILAVKSPVYQPLTSLDVANMLEAMKIARRYSGAHNLDDYIDGAGYAGVAGEVAEHLIGHQKFLDFLEGEK